MAARRGDLTKLKALKNALLLTCAVFPGIALGITVFGFALVGSSIEVLADPARRRVLSGSMG